ncbi:MAG: hypothetical protein RSD57_15915 [Comamonas sp.]
MKIQLSPQVRNGELNVSKSGDTLTINGTVYDFAPLSDGALLPAAAIQCEHIVGDVTRVGGQLHITLLLPIAWDAPHETCFPEPIVNPPDGVINLPGGAA